MKAFPYQMYLNNKRLVPGRVPRRIERPILIEVKGAYAAMGIASFPCPFCEHGISTNRSTTCPSCEAEFEFQHKGHEIMLSAWRGSDCPRL